MPYSKFEVGRSMFIGLDFSPLRGGFIKPPALRVVGDFCYHMILSFIIFIIHIVWQLNLKRSNDLDRIRINRDEDEIRRFFDFEIEKMDRKDVLCIFRPFIFKGWSHFLYVIITCVLLSTSVYIVHNQQQNKITLPNDIHGWLEIHLIDGKEKQKYIIKKLGSAMDSEGKANQANSADAKIRAAD